MTKLTAKQKANFKNSTFGLPAERKYPINDRKRAGNAKARASQQYKKGNLSLAEEKKIDRKVDQKLYKSK